jgi:hypothetical protein
MHHKNTEIQATDDIYILKKNINTVLPKIDLIAKLGYVSPFALIFWTASLVFTLPGALIKTVVDINTRKKLSAADLKTTKENIDNFDDHDFDSLVENISATYPAYRASSDSSKKLLSEFASAEQTEKDNYRNAKQQKIINKKKADYHEHERKHHEPLAKNGIKIVSNTKVEFQLTEDDNQAIQNSITKKNKNHTFKNQARNKNRQAITAFLEAPHNAGKKLQHVIKAETKNIRKNL